jgi:hypothetical protein
MIHVYVFFSSYLYKDEYQEIDKDVVSSYHAPCSTTLTKFLANFPNSMAGIELGDCIVTGLLQVSWLQTELSSGICPKTFTEGMLGDLVEKIKLVLWQLGHKKWLILWTTPKTFLG